MEHLDGRIWEYLQDDRFIKWVRIPDEETNAWWEAWMAAHPEELTNLFKAREIARDLAYTETPAGAHHMEAAIWSGIEERLEAAGERAEAIGERSKAIGERAEAAETGNSGEEFMPAPVIEMIPKRRRRAGWYIAAACLAGLAIAGVGSGYFKQASPVNIKPVEQVVSRLTENELQRTNGTGTNQQVCLVDGTKITLQPGAAIRHALFLKKDRREVYLEGNAFFEIAKDAARPFYVYTKDLEVRVLGTSFNVVTDKNNGDIAVMVETGKVSVNRKGNAGKQPVILEQNQQALYKAGTRMLVQAADSKGPANMKIEAPAIAFDFDQTPVVEIFKRLESAYGVPLHYDEKDYSGCSTCSVTTSLPNESFEEKLQIVCRSVGAVYRIKEGGVWIEGHGN